MMPQPDGPLSTGTLVLPRQGPSVPPVPQQGSSAPTPAIAPDRILLAAAATTTTRGSTLRRLAGLVTLAAAVVALGPAGPAGAESTADCHARLNAVRARAGLPRASAGTLPALARAAASHAAYRVRVDPGDHALVRRLRDRGPFGPDATAHQQTPSLRALGYSGVNPWDRTRAAGLKDGSWRYQYEDVVTATGVTATGVTATA
jgi:hypothetical protein